MLSTTCVSILSSAWPEMFFVLPCIPSSPSMQLYVAQVEDKQCPISAENAYVHLARWVIKPSSSKSMPSGKITYGMETDSWSLNHLRDEMKFFQLSLLSAFNCGDVEWQTIWLQCDESMVSYQIFHMVTLSNCMVGWARSKADISRQSNIPIECCSLLNPSLTEVTLAWDFENFICIFILLYLFHILWWFYVRLYYILMSPRELELANFRSVHMCV